MKIFLNKILFLLTIAFMVGSCSDDDQLVINPDAETTATLSDTEVVLDKDEVGTDVLTVTWTEPDFGYNAAVNYKIYFNKAGGDAADAESVNGGTSFSKTFKSEELNKILLNLELEPDEAADVTVVVAAILNDKTGYGILSDPNTLKATPYADVLDLSTAWGLVGDAYNNWGNPGPDYRPDAPFYKTDEAGIYVCYVTLKNGKWKIRKDNKWDLDYGDKLPLDGVFDREGGNDIAVNAGSYKIVFNENTLAYTIEKYSWGIVGSAYNEWGAAGPDAPLIYDPFSDTWRAVVTLKTGLMKIRQNNEWSVDYGDKTGDGILDREADNNISVTAGNYLVIVDFKDLSYTIEETDIWGVVGGAYNNWGNQGPGYRPDYPFTPDFSKEGVYYIESITLIDGYIKFRTNNDWAVAYGDKPPVDGILDTEGGNDIQVTAGTYSITMDLSDPDNMTYTITKK